MGILFLCLIFSQMFVVKLIGVTGDAGLGPTTSVRIAIRKNDSPTGLFRFSTSKVGF